MKGRIEVVKKDLEARLSFTPDDAGESFDVDGLRALLSQASVRVEVSDSDLEEALKLFSSATEAVESDVVARGVPAVAAQGMKVFFTGGELPSDIAETLDLLLEDAAPIEGEIKTAWAEAEAPVGTIEPAIAARAGLDLNRDPIAAPEGDEAADVMIGEGLTIQGSDVIALETGILRYSEENADLVACRKHEWSVSGGPEDGGCFLDYVPGVQQIPPPEASVILAGAGRLGFLEEKLISEEKLRALLADTVTEESQLSGYPISADTDGKVSIEIDPMEVLAELVIRRETGDGVPLELKTIASAIRNSGLRGLDGDAVKAAIMAFWKSGDSAGRITIKKGKAPERGPNRELEYLVPFLDEEDAAPVRERLEFEPEKALGIASLKVFPAAAVSKVALATAEQGVARLGSSKTGKAGKDIYGNELPGIPGNDPDIRVHEGLRWDGDSIMAESDGIMDIGNTMDGITHLRIRPHKDALVQVSVAEDKMKAHVSIRLPVGTGSPVDAERIKAEAEKVEVVKGFLDEEIDRAVEKSLTGEFVAGMCIAEGRLPMEGNTRLSLSMPGDPAKAPIPVKAGDEIGTVQADDDSGWNVLGEEIMEESGALSQGECIIKEEREGLTVLKAEKSGHLIMKDGTLYVRHLLDYVGDVSMASGNIRFPGIVKIDGSVLSRVVVDGGEGVEISQVVQAALVNSGGDVTIGKGIKGEGKAVIRSQGALSLSYAEEANLLTTGNIVVGKALMNCRVKCNGTLSFQGEGGQVIGGSMKLKDGLICSSVGNEREVETVISFGQDYLVENQIDQIQDETRKIQEFIDKTDQMMAELEQKPGTGKKLIIIRQKKVDALKMLEKKNMRLFLLREKFERHFESEIKVTGTVWPGTTFESHGRLIQVKESMNGVKITFNPEKGRLEKKPI